MNAPAHAMMPGTTHDEAARLGFVVSLKQFVFGEVEGRLRQVVDGTLAPAMQAAGREPDARVLDRALGTRGAYRAWQRLMVDSQEQMWQAAGECVDRQRGALEARAAEWAGRAAAGAGRGTLTLDPGFEVPRYLRAVDTHLMPGSYYACSSATDVRAGALFDKAAAIYHTGRNGGELNDVRGHTIVQHGFERFPDLAPRRVLDLGCTVGHSTVAIARYFPQAETHAIDVGAALLRYAHARAEALDTPIHFRQASAEATGYPDAHFDLVVSSAVLHETSRAAIPRIFAEARRILRPGGAMIHLEVPARFDAIGPWGRLRGHYEAHYNNEPFWIGALSADLVALARDAGFVDAADGYQGATQRAARDAAPTFTSKAGPVHACWYLMSARRP